MLKNCNGRINKSTTVIDSELNRLSYGWA